MVEALADAANPVTPEALDPATTTSPPTAARTLRRYRIALSSPYVVFVLTAGIPHGAETRHQLE
jgi:hypothetical protein